MGNNPQKIADALFAEVGEGESLYGILDAARNFDIPFSLRSASVEYDSLYRGQKEETLWHVAPYLVRWERESPFFQWMLEKGWGDSWGIFLTSRASVEELRKHFRQFLLIEDENGKEMYFRFYDPRVLRVYLPTCDEEDIRQLFGPVTNFLIEDEDVRKLLQFSPKASGITAAIVLLDKGEAVSEE